MKSRVVNAIDFFDVLSRFTLNHELQVHTSYSPQSKKYFTTYYFYFGGEVHNVAYQDCDFSTSEVEYGLYYDGVE